MSKFESLLISSPNNGGLFLAYEESIYQLDNLNTTGLYHFDKRILRGIQPSELYIYDYQKHIAPQRLTSPSFHDIHDIYVEKDFLYLIGTTGNEIIKLSKNGVETHRWAFPGEEDSRHINCLANWNNRIIFSAFGDFSEHRGYKGKTHQAGFVQDLLSSQPLITRLSQPHSLIPYGENLLLANSECMEILEFSPLGTLLRAKKLDGYTRGICVGKKAIYVGLSKSRNVDDNGLNSAAIVSLDPISLEELGRIYLPCNEIYNIQHIVDPTLLIHLTASISATSTTRLCATLAEHETQVNQSVEQITNLHAQIGIFNQELVERDAQITALNQELVERDAQITALNQELVERDAQITALNQELVKRDAQITTLNQALIARDAQFNALYRSTSWRITAPLRLVVRKIKRLGHITMRLALRKEPIK